MKSNSVIFEGETNRTEVGSMILAADWQEVARISKHMNIRLTNMLENARSTKRKELKEKDAFDGIIDWPYRKG